MSQRKNIDELFKEGIAGMSAEPSEKVWSGIEQGYFSTKAGGRRWMYYSLAALLLLLGGVGGWLIFSGDSETSNIPQMESFSQQETTAQESASTVELTDQVDEVTENGNGDESSTSETNTSEQMDADYYAGFSRSDESITTELKAEFDDTQSDAEIVVVEPEAQIIYTTTNSIYSDIGYMNSMSVELENTRLIVILSILRKCLE